LPPLEIPVFFESLQFLLLALENLGGESSFVPCGNQSEGKEIEGEKREQESRKFGEMEKKPRVLCPLIEFVGVSSHLHPLGSRVFLNELFLMDSL
jgi:hypothetical protein